MLSQSPFKSHSQWGRCYMPIWQIREWRSREENNLPGVEVKSQDIYQGCLPLKTFLLTMNLLCFPTERENSRKRWIGLYREGQSKREVDRWEWRNKSGEAGQNASLTIGMHKVEGGHGEGCTTQRTQLGILQHLTMIMDSDCSEVSGGISLTGAV